MKYLKSDKLIMEDKKLEVKDLVEYSKNQEGKIFKNTNEESS